jgi:hypothetical protein
MTLPAFGEIYLIVLARLFYFTNKKAWSGALKADD